LQESGYDVGFVQDEGGPGLGMTDIRYTEFVVYKGILKSYASCQGMKSNAIYGAA
jgi:hypothetical protein